jgi:hypothetical protein
MGAIKPWHLLVCLVLVVVVLAISAGIVAASRRR